MKRLVVLLVAYSVTATPCGAFITLFDSAQSAQQKKLNQQLLKAVESQQDWNVKKYLEKGACTTAITNFETSHFNGCYVGKPTVWNKREGKKITTNTPLGHAHYMCEAKQKQLKWYQKTLKEIEQDLQTLDPQTKLAEYEHAQWRLWYFQREQTTALREYQEARIILALLDKNCPADQTEMSFSPSKPTEKTYYPFKIYYNVVLPIVGLIKKS